MLIASLMVNVCLAIWLLGPSLLADWRHVEGDWSYPHKVSKLTSISGESARIPEPGTHGEVRQEASAPGLSWQQVESADYRQYVANLRAIGCPEQTVRDIIFADLRQANASRASAISDSRPTAQFWQKSRASRPPSPEQRQQLLALGQEEQAVFKQLTGADALGLQQVNVLLMNPNTLLSDLAFLPESKRQAAYRALCRQDLAYFERRDDPENDGGKAQRRLDALAGILSAEELEEFHLRSDPEAEKVRLSLSYFESTPEEFNTLVKWREDLRSKANASNDPYAGMADEAAAFSQLFGEARGREYAQKTDIFYVWARRAAERYGLSADAAERAWNIKRDAIAAVQAFRADTSLSANDRRQRLEALHRDTMTELVDVLGARGAAVAVRGDWWLQNPTFEFGP